MGVKVLTDSTSYIDNNVIIDLGIKVVSLNVTFEDEEFKEMDIDNKEFYKMMEKKGIPTSSQPSVQDLYDEMEAIVKTGDSLICVFISSEMSGTYSTAHLVREMILENYKDAKIEIIDSRSNCMQLGFAVLEAARGAKAGADLESVKNLVLTNIKRSRFLFVPDSLEYLRKGGRIGNASSLIGTLLKIIPILTVENGKTTILTKIRTKKKAVETMIDRMISDINEYGLKEIMVHHINCIDEATELASYISNKLKVPVGICNIGPVIGLHVGPKTLAVVYYTEKDMR